MSSAAATADDSKADADKLVMRAKPRPVIRFKRSAVIAASVAVAVSVCAVLWFALEPAKKALVKGENLITTGQQAISDKVRNLKASYSPGPAPALGPALDGDLGKAELRARRGLGLPAVGGAAGEGDAARAQELHTAQMARQANEGGVFFGSGGSRASGSAGPVAATDGNGLPLPFNQPSAALALDPARDPSAVGRKLDFMNATDSRSIYNAHSLQDPASPYQVMAGTLISASLITGLDSDLPGLVVGQITQSVYDTVTGRILLIPQGSRLIGTYDSVVAFGQSRALVVWQRIIMPDGSSIQIDNLPATDAQGYSGLQDDVDYHTWALLKGVAISTLLGIGSELAISGQSDLLMSIRTSTQDSVNQAGQQITQKNLNIAPTIRVRPGWPLRVIVHKDLILRPYKG